MMNDEDDLYDAVRDYRKGHPEKLTKPDSTSEHLKNIKLLQAIYAGKKFYVECYPTDEGAICFPNSNFSVKIIDIPNFNHKN